MTLRGPNWRVLGVEDDEMFIDIESTFCALHGFGIKFYDARRTNTRSNRKTPEFTVNSIINDLINAINRK
jgi:hypothetical protein